jgi:hypothetical protein
MAELWGCRIGNWRCSRRPTRPAGRSATRGDDPRRGAARPAAPWLVGGDRGWSHGAGGEAGASSQSVSMTSTTCLLPAVSMPRLWALRAMYLLIVVGLALVVWPGVLHRAHAWELFEGVSQCMLAAFSALCVIGLLRPLTMLPLLLWELLWKSIWLLDVVLPQWRAGTLDEQTAGIAASCVLAAIIPFVVPWRYVVANWFRKPGASVQ